MALSQHLNKGSWPIKHRYYYSVRDDKCKKCNRRLVSKTSQVNGICGVCDTLLPRLAFYKKHHIKKDTKEIWNLFWSRTAATSGGAGYFKNK